MPAADSIVGMVLILIVTAVLYAPALSYGWVYEDNNDLTGFTRAATATEYVNRLAHRPTRALTEGTFFVNRAVFGADNPMGYHAGSVAVHLVNVALLLWLAWCWVPPLPALLVAAAFAVHPLNVEAVAYVSARAELVAASGVLLALLAASRGSFAGALCGVLLACLGKETAVMAWGLVPLWTWATRTAFPVQRWFLTGAGLGLAALLFTNPGSTTIGFDVFSVGLHLDTIGRSSSAVWRLVSLVFVPVGLTIDHDWHGVSFWLQMAAAVGLLVAMAASTLAVRAGRSWLTLATLATGLWFLPRFVVPVSEGLHEHHMVIPLAVWLLCAGAWLSRFTFRAEYPSHG